MSSFSASQTRTGGTPYVSARNPANKIRVFAGKNSALAFSQQHG